MHTLPPDPFAIATLDALAEHYAEPAELVRNKEGDRIGLGANGPHGPHIAPRGDSPGFVAAADERALFLPDRRSNNRLDGLRDILHDPRVALLFLVSGARESLGVHGRARITADRSLRARRAAQGKEPATLLAISLESLFIQCAKALMRSRLWGEAARPAGLPTRGKLVAEHTANRVDALAPDARLPQTHRQKLC
jgi:hypothetical protein